MNIMQSNLKAIHLTAWGMILLGGLLFCSKSAFSQDGSTTPRTLIVGVMVAPPLYMKTADNRGGGLQR